MTTTTDPHGWPDPARPGYPANPERDGWHWLRTPDDQTAPYEWRTAGECERGRWPSHWVSGVDEWKGTDCAYLGPCLTPAEVAAFVRRETADMERDLRDANDAVAAAVQAEREACSQIADEAGIKNNPRWGYRTDEAQAAYDAADDIADAIRARGPTPALAEALAQARREGMEEERKAWAVMWARHRNPVAFSEAMQKHIAIRSAAAGGEGT